MTAIDLGFALNVALPLTQAAYHPDKPELPAGWEKTGDIVLAGSLGITLFARWVTGDPLGTSFGITATDGKTTAICFRGTESAVEWADDLDAIVARDGAEEGFEDIYRALATPLPTADTIVAGHSLGGALALLYAEQYLPPSAAIYTFGCPRVFTRERAMVFDSTHPNCYRFANMWDIVPKSPPLWFKHVGIPIDVDGGISLDLHVNHRLIWTYRNGIFKLLEKLRKKTASQSASQPQPA
jgi:pimeloyl-ACP methyl ester carboxylesterase